MILTLAHYYSLKFHTKMMQEEGWPLGLRFLNGRIGLVENDDEFSGPMLTASPTSSIDSSSDLEFQVCSLL